MKKISFFLIALALVVGVVGCGGGGNGDSESYTLSISSTAGGSVVEPGEGSFTYDEGAVVSLIAEAEEGYWFIEWTGDVETIGDVDAGSTTISMADDYSITATFQEDEIVQFADPNLESAIREAIDKPTGDIYASDLKGLTSLDVQERNITSLGGLEYAADLAVLRFRDNQITDVSPLANLTNLKHLDLNGNNISDISPLSGLTNLTYLNLGDNQISDISPLSGLTSLTRLYLWDNQISDISPLSGLTSLTRLYLWDNQISDISPLVDNSGLGDGDDVYLTNNPLSDTSINVYIPELEARGVTVYY